MLEVIGPAGWIHQPWTPLCYLDPGNPDRPWAIPPGLVGLEACATAHHWARELIALGHVLRLIPPTYVKAYVKRDKHDVADAEAICEAVRRPSMRFVPIKTAEQQSALMMHRVRIAEPFRPLSSTRPFSAEFCISSCPGSVVFVMPTKKRKDMPGLHWAANEIALDFVAIGLAQEIELLGAFDALCDDADL